ncbi:hypothetical protein BGW80DRAFT_1447978 [Lactifluus volemus]|nr:hypothetical protein BGW80DRAFT_1447978 [Lactifluus volemus]
MHLSPLIRSSCTSVAESGSTSRSLQNEECILGKHQTGKEGKKAAQATFKSIGSLVPLLDRVLVQLFKPETVQNCHWNLLPPDFCHVDSTPEATVIAVGPGAPDKEGRIVPTSVKAGDMLLLPGWGGSAIKVGEDEYHLFKGSELSEKIEEQKGPFF